MSEQEFLSYIGTVHSSISGSTGEYLATSISLNFESDRVALSTSNVSNYTGRVDIHDYGTSWTKIFSLSGPDGQNSSFGHEISLNWSGTRLAVSAYEVNKVYILDAIGTGSNIWSSYVSNTLNTSSLSLPGSAEFGYSISLAQDDGNRIAVGAPGQNKVYVYEYDNVNNNWGNGPVWTSTDSGINNVLAYAVDSSGLATSYIHAHAISNRYGHKVRLSAFGNYLIIGAPGETNASINSTTAYYPEGTTTNYTGSYTGQHQIGHVRCYTNYTTTWASGTTQYGQDIRGKAGTVVGTDNQPSFGTSCDISTNGNKITVSSPYKKVSTLSDAGQIDTYLINDDLDTWLSVSTSIAGSKSSQKLGMNLRLDFAGERLVTGDLSTSNQESAYYGGISLYALDFGTDRWYDITPPIQVHNWPTVGSIDFNPVDITNGKILAISDPRDPPGNAQSTAGNSGKVVFYQFPLTNAFQGNMSVGGYVKCENIYVGANDNSNNTNHLIPNKRISFGGTIKDNSYEETYIENRSVDGTGKSELLLYKRNDIWDKAGGNPHSTNPANMVDDSIRIKAAEICLDYEDTNLHGTYPNAATRNTRLRMNRGGQVAIGDSYHNNAAHILSPFDINCRSYFWTMVNIGNNTAKPVTQVPGIDTNNERLFENQGVSHSPIGGGKYGSQQFERRNISSQVWDSQEYGFYFSSSNATIYAAYHPGNWHSSSLGFACWIKLNDTPANCSGVLMWWGEDHYRAGSVFKGGYVKIVSGGLSIEYEPNSANALSVSYTFEQDTWYQIRGLVPAENAHPSLSASITDFPAIQINGVSQTVTGPGEGGAAHASAYTSGSDSWDDSSYGFGSALTYSRNSNGDINREQNWEKTPIVNGDHNNGVKNCWIALMSIGDGGGYAHPDSHLIFPGELLTVAGTTTIGRHLGIRQNIPQYPLDVTGDINLTGALRIGGVAQSFGGGSPVWSSYPSSAVGVYPLIAMTSNSSGPHVASASSTWASDWQAWKAFNKVVGDEGWHTVDAYNSSTGNYTGIQSTTYNGSSTVSGEWIQLQFTTGGIATNKIEIAPRTGYVNRCAGDGIILGSTDGSTWTSIHSFSGQTYTNGQYTSITFTTSSVYTYLRLVVTKLASTGHQPLNISEIQYTGVDIESNIYYVGNVGIGTSSPAYTLDVSGTMNLTSGLRVNGSAGTSGQVLTSSGGGAMSWTTVSGGGSPVWSLNGTNAYYNNGNVGIGTNLPTAKLTINSTGTANPDSNGIYVYNPTSGSGDAIITARVNGAGGDPYLSLDVNGISGWSFGIDSSDARKLKWSSSWNGLTSATKMTLDTSGNLGIGTTSPAYKLDVNGDINMSSGSSLRINGVAQSFGGGSSPWTTSGSNIYRSSGQVNIGGSTFTRAKLEINGSYSSYLSYRYYAYGAYGGLADGNNPYGIYCDQRIACSEFNAHSDIRIKKNVVDINDSSALDKIRLIEPKIYNYIDEKSRGTSNVYGFIAQQVYDVLPYAVTVSEGDIPNILRNAYVSVIDNNTVELTLESSVEELSLSNTSVINIITDNDKVLKCNVLSFSETNVITIENTSDFSNVTTAFIKGEQVSDFHHLNKDAIWAVSTAALQEVDRQLQAEKVKVSTLETQIVDLLENVANLLARVTALES